MQYLRRTYTTPCRFYAGSDVEHLKQWYWAEEGASVFPLYNIFGSRFFMDRQVLEDDWSYPGERPGPFTFNDGSNPHDATGQLGCQIGEDSWFVNGVPTGKVLDLNSIPDCCGVWTPILTIEGAQQEFGFPNITVPSPYWEVGRWSLLAVIFDGDQSIPPTPPSGWDVLMNMSLSSDLWVMVCQKLITDSDPLPFTIDGGSTFESAGLMTFIREESDGFTDFDSDSEIGDSNVTAPSLDSPNINALLVCCFIVDSDSAVTTPPADMVEADAVLLSSGSLYIYSQQKVGSGLTGERDADYGSPVTGIGLSLLGT